MSYISEVLNSKKETTGKYELKRKNPFSLLEDSNLDSSLKSLKIGDKLTPIQLSNDEVRFASYSPKA